MENSPYEGLGLDCWPKSRDARRWPGGNPIIAHPPCAQWGKLRHIALRTLQQKALAPWSVLLAREWGGVVEHPEGSALWDFMRLPEPGEQDEWGFTTVVDQLWFGHRAQKRTRLYVCGLRPDQMPRFDLDLSYAPRTVESMGRSERERTPIGFARYLKETASAIYDHSPRYGA